jgi:regulator of sigma E protease
LFPAIPDFIRTGGAFVVVLGVLVFVHEFGHYLAARWRHVHVDVFSIGFGRAIVSWTDKVGTVWKVAWIPLGGYVKLHGQERPEDVTDEERATWMPGRTFQEKSVLSRAIVVAAGPVANFVLAIVLFSLLFATAGRPVTLPVVGEVVAGSAAAHAGLMPGDRIEAIGSTPIVSFADVQHFIAAHPAEHLELKLHRAGVTMTLPVLTDSRDDGRIGVLGIAGGQVEYVHVGPAQAVVAGVAQTWEITAQTFSSVAQIIGGSRGTEGLGGPLRIAQLSGEVAQLGLASLVSFIAVLSVNLGLINLFPVPVLDGGHLLFYLVEAIRGRPLPPKAQMVGFRAGLALLAGLFIFTTWNDLSHLGIFRWVSGLMG